ncbi:hypothetical protein WN51_01249 [Melipona quadrifasciata]|uniref:Uncharacterized protein n=1 Tax=Melipona quadrifasciata TaxID=166423 RepID=A0A0N0BF13_9HYME|nr:hypothetical protein WN51_01249 [Melipona quadrifasciata]
MRVWKNSVQAVENREEERSEKDWCDPLSERVFKMNESCEPTSVTVSLPSEETEREPQTEELQE